VEAEEIAETKLHRMGVSIALASLLLGYLFAGFFNGQIVAACY